MNIRHSLLLALLTFPLLAQPSPRMQELLTATIDALNGDAAAFERYAQERYAKEFLAKRTPQQRAALLSRLRADFGRIEARGAQRMSPERVGIAIAGSTGMRGRLVLDHDDAYKITGLEIRVGDDDARPELPPVPVRGDMNGKDLAAALEPYLRNLHETSRFDGSVLIARNGSAILEKSYGFANRADKVPNTAATRFSVGSINKHFTKIAIARLAAEGKLSLDETLGKHIPDHPNATAQKATIRQLLDHTAGLGDFMGPEFRGASKGDLRSNRDWFRFVSSKPLTFDPGTRRQYCNNCYITLGEIIERVSGVPYEQYIERNVFVPAGMRGAGFLMADAIEPNVAIGYTTRHGGLRANTLLRGAAGSAAGSAYATPADLLAFDNALRDGKLLDPKWTAWMFGSDAPFEGRASAAEAYAGGAEGVNAVVESDAKWTVIVLANIDPPAAESLGMAIYRALAER